MTETEHAQWIKQLWLDKSDEIKGADRMTDLNEAVRIAYQQGRKDALEEVRAEIEQIQGNEYEVSDMQGNRYKYETITKGEVLQIIDKYKGE